MCGGYFRGARWDTGNRRKKESRRPYFRLAKKNAASSAHFPVCKIRGAAMAQVRHAPSRRTANLSRLISREALNFSYRKGSTAAPSSVSSNPVKLIAETMIVQLCSVSFSVKPLSLLTVQNPLSFIHESIFEPKPIAR